MDTGKFIQGINHVALNVKNLEHSKSFYTQVLGMDVLYQDAMHVFLKVGEDKSFGVLALLAKPKSGPEPVDPASRQGNQYNHFGFRANTSAQVFAFAEHLKKNAVKILK